MDEPIPYVTLAIIGVTAVYSWLGFRQPDFHARHLFSVRGILVERQYDRFFTSALLHADWNHLLMNMVTLFLFGRGIELDRGIGMFLAIYLVSILGGGALSLLIHRHHEYYAHGASGGVCGIVFSAIFLFPGAGVVMYPVPIAVPAWLYVLLFMIGSTIALRRQADNIGHDAHLGGAILGLLTTAALDPTVVRLQPKLFALVLGLACLLFVMLVKFPLFLPLRAFKSAGREEAEADKRIAQAEKTAAELDAILDKISRQGLQSLTAREKAKLNAASKKSSGA